jgi:signal transduction histidine kinase/DNA-binding response OmpR family regulator
VAKFGQSGMKKTLNRSTKMKKYLWFLFFLLVGCSDNQNTTDSELIIGFSQCTMIDQWRKTMIEEMQREISFNRNYNIKLIVRDANSNNDQQIKDINDLVSEGIDLLIVSPNEAEQLTATVSEVYEHGIPVIIIDRKINSEKYTAFIGADNFIVGSEAGRFAAELLNGKGNILEITGLSGSTPAIERSSGFQQVLNANPEMRIVKSIEGAWLEERALMMTDSLFYTFNDFDLVFAHNDFMAHAVYVSAKKHRLKPYIIGVDGLNTENGGVNMVLNGFIDGTVLYPTGGEKAIQLAIDILMGQQYERLNYLNIFKIDNTNARTIWLQSQQMKDQQYKIDNQVQQLDSMSSILKRQNSLLLLTYSSIALLALVVVVIILALSQKNRLNKQLDAKNKTINNQNKVITQQRDDSIGLLMVAEEAKENKLRLFTDISHELRTVVTLITNPIQEIIQSTKDDSIKGKLNLLERSSDRLTRLLESILKFRNLDENKYRLNFTSANISNFVLNIVETLQNQANKKNIKLSTDISEEIFAEFDISVIEKVMYNLLSNAIRCTNNFGAVNVLIRKDESKIHIQVMDTGVGIPQGELPYLFNRFYKVKSSKNFSEDGGIGIGLALSKELIQLHGGHISVSSTESQGTTFNIVIPQFHLHGIQHKSEAIVELSAIDNTQSIVGAAGHTILVVEDNPDLLLVIADIIRKNYHVITALNGKEGFTLAKNKSPDLIVSDILMPVMDGMQMCMEVKKNPTTCHIPVVLLTAIDSQESTIKGFDIGADAYLTKPFNELLLLSHIKNLIESREKLRAFYSPSPFFRSLFKTKDAADQEFINGCLDSIYENLDLENYKLDNLAEKMNLSRSSLYRKIKEVTDLKPVDFIKKAKLNYAAKLLLSNRLNINEISWRSGFSDAKYFSKCFLQEYGEHPSKFIEKVANNHY